MYDGYLIATHGFIKKKGPIAEEHKKKTAKIKAEYEKDNAGAELIKEILGE